MARWRTHACGRRRINCATPSVRARTHFHPVYRWLVKLTLDELRPIEDQLAQLDQQMADLLTAHHDAVQRLAEVPGLGVDSAQQIIAEVGASAAAFPSAKQLASWMGACPGNEERAGVNYSHCCPKGNRQMRRVLNQAANAAVKAKGSIFAIVYRRLVPRLGHAQAVGAIAHRLCRLIWKILHQGVRYEERGAGCQRRGDEDASNFSRLRRAARHDRERFSTLAHPCGDILPSAPRARAELLAGSAEVDELVRYQGRFLNLVRAERRFDSALYRTRTLSSTGVQVFP